MAINRAMFHASIVLAVCAAGSAAQAQSYMNYSCQDLWVERNSVYKAGGYCFNTARAITYFGNGGCQFTNQADVPISANDRVRINAIVAAERAKGCN